jgi:glycosyltransferase involved in cell wall biosynthesis
MTADAVGGVWTYALDLARALSAGGRREEEGEKAGETEGANDKGEVTVALAVMGPAPSPAQRAEAASIPNLAIYEAPFNLEWMDDAWPDVHAAGQWLLDLEDQLHPDVVHLNGYAHAAMSWRAPVMVTGHSCVLSWWNAVHGTDVPRRWDQYARAVSNGLRHANVVVAPTAAMLSCLLHHYGPVRSGRVIPNGRYAAAAPAPAKEPVVFTAGRVWDPAKNVAAVCEVASELPWRVYVAGEWQQPGGGATFRCDSAVTRLGALPPKEMANWMARASIYALPARYEPFGLSALEAALAGCALVLGDIRSLREVWGDAALFVPADNRRALHAALLMLIDDEGLRSEMASRAQRRAATFTPQRMATAYFDAYTSMTGNSSETVAM